MADNEEMLENSAEEPAGAANETKSEKFQRLASARVNKIIKAVDQLGNLSNRSSYDYTQEQADKMFEAIQKKLDDAKAKFAPKSSDGDKEEFHF